MYCPIDHTAFVPHAVDGASSHRCPTCEGIFLPGDFYHEIRARAALQAHQKTDSLAGKVTQQPRQLNCPNDANLMMSFMFKGVEVDVCSKCYGVWLDRGEMEIVTGQIGLPKKADLSKIGVTLAPVNASAGIHAQDISDVADLLEVVFDVCSWVADLPS